MKANLQLFWLALSFYTRLPVPKHLDYSQLPKAVRLLPLVGWVVGSLTGLCFMLAHHLWPQNVAVILTLIVGVLLTGAFHEDGFADVCDGFGGGYGKPQILSIMKDSQIGAYGAIGILLLFMLKITLLSGLPAQSLPVIFFAGQSVSRLPPLLIMQQYDYARTENSKSHVAIYKPEWQDLFSAGVIAVLPFWLLPAILVLSLPVIYFINSQLARFFYRHLSGYTGDCLGASQQVSEMIFYLCCAALWTFT